MARHTIKTRKGLSGRIITPAKACKILKDGQVNGKPLTKKQRGKFGAECARKKK